MAESQYEDLEINEDYEFHKKTWRVQRLGWIVIMLMLVAAILGAFGSGLLSSTEIFKENIGAKYERFLRYETTSELTFTLHTQTPDSITKVWINRAYIDDFQIEQITPEPEVSAIDKYRILYQFRVARPGEPIVVHCFLKTNKIGFLKARAGVENGGTLEFSQFVYP